MSLTFTAWSTLYQLRQILCTGKICPRALFSPPFSSHIRLYIHNPSMVEICPHALFPPLPPSYFHLYWCNAAAYLALHGSSRAHQWLITNHVPALPPMSTYSCLGWSDAVVQTALHGCPPWLTRFTKDPGQESKQRRMMFADCIGTLNSSSTSGITAHAPSCAVQYHFAHHDSTSPLKCIVEYMKMYAQGRRC